MSKQKKQSFTTMIKPNKSNINILIDLVYDGAMNQFEEFYGDSVSYHELEQQSYIELKSMLTSAIGRVKFRKARDIIAPKGLTCKLEMSQNQYDKFIDIYSRDNEKSRYDKFSFVFGFKIDNVRIDTEPDVLRPKGK